MPLPPLLKGKLDIPVIGAPMLVPCHPPLLLAQCTNGMVGAMPALSARPQEQLEEWLCDIEDALATFQLDNPDRRVAPFAINQIVHKSNVRLDGDLAVCVKHKVPIIITSLGANSDLVKEVHSYGGIVFHDVISARHAEKALEHGVDGLVLLTAGGGGHGGNLNPFAFVTEVRRFYNGPLVVSGGLTTGQAIAAVRVLGADLAYMGTRFLAAHEARVNDDWKRMIVESSAKDVLYSPWFNGVHASWLKPSIAAMGIDPDDPKLLLKNDVTMDMADENSKARTTLYSAGHGVGNVDRREPAADIIARLKAEYSAAIADSPSTDYNKT